MARHSQPNNIKVLKGETRAERFEPDGVDIDGLTELPAPPDWWNIRTVRYYENIGALLMAHKLLTVLDIDYLFKFCWLSVKIDKICENDDTPSMSMYTQHDKYSAKLGLTPIDRQKFRAEPSAKKGNKYAKSKPKK